MRVLSLTQPWASFLIGGGSLPWTRVEIVTKDDGKVIHTARGHNDETMGRSVVAVSLDHGRNFELLYTLSTSHFINVSVNKVNLRDWPGFPQSDGEGLAIFGSGSYRRATCASLFNPRAPSKTFRPCDTSPDSTRPEIRFGHRMSWTPSRCSTSRAWASCRSPGTNSSGAG